MITIFVKRLFVNAMEVLRPRDTSDTLMIFTSCGLLLYTFVMAYISDIEYDEAYTYLHYSMKDRPGFLDIDLANNHPLNSFLVYTFSFLFRYNELAIRLPNLLFLIVYLTCSIKISKIVPQLKLFTFALLTLYWYLSPLYFSQARGYGISTALVLCFLVSFKQEVQDFRKIIVNFYILLMATYAFTGLLPLAIALMIYYLLFEIKFDVLKFIKQYFFDLTLLAINFWYLTYLLIAVSKKGKPLFGSTQPFIESTLGFYLNSFFKNTTGLNNYLLFLIFIIFAILCIVSILLKKKQARVCFITVLTFAIFYLASSISGRPYVTGRLLLPLYPLVVLSVSELLHFGVEHLRDRKRLLIVVNFITFFVFIINYLHTSGFEIKNNPWDYKKEIFKKLNLNVKHDGCCSSIPFYLAKFQLYPPIDVIKASPATIKNMVTNDLKLFYFEEKSVLLLEASPPADINTRFFLHVYPKHIDALAENRKQYGFDNLDFSWNIYNKKYMIIQMPNYELFYFKIGQFDENGVKWEKRFK